MDFGKKLAVVVVHYGDPVPTRRTLDSIGELRPKPNRVFVVDNSGDFEWTGSGVADVEVIGGLGNMGYAGAVNLGARAARDTTHELLWVLNNDVEVAPNALLWWELALSQNPTAEILGSYVTRADGRCWFGGGSFDPRRGVARHLHFGEALSDLDAGGIAPTDWINGCSMVIPIREFQARGAFDESLFLYKEELEWQTRNPQVRAYVVQQPLVRHWVGLSTGSTGGRLGKAFMARNGMILANRQRGRRRVAWLASWGWEFLLLPLLRRDWSALAVAIAGARGRRMDPVEFLDCL